MPGRPRLIPWVDILPGSLQGEGSLAPAGGVVPDSSPIRGRGPEVGGRLIILFPNDGEEILILWRGGEGFLPCRV